VTQAVARIRADIEQLSDSKRREVWRAVVERVPVSGELSNDNFAALIPESLRALDEEEGGRRA
jgi:hypothetical protein